MPDREKEIFERENPLFKNKYQRWLDSALAFDGGEDYIKKFLIKHQSETTNMFKERKNRAFYLNYARKIATLLSNYQFSKPPVRTDADSDIVADFDRTGLNVNEIMRIASLITNIFGMGYALVDMVAIDNNNVTLADKKKKKLRPYVRMLNPLQITDFNMGDDGLLNWAIIIEHYRDDTDPFKKAVEKQRRRLWTKTDWTLFEKDPKTDKIVVIATEAHPLGVVPIIQFGDVDSYSVNNKIHWFEDIVRINNAIFNNCSESQMNIVMQMFGLLIMPESWAQINTPLEESEQEDDLDGNTPLSSRTKQQVQESLPTIIDKTIALTESADERGISRYISPGGSETAAIREENKHLKAEMYDVVGLALQSSSKQAQTAESKSYDNLNMQQGLACRADSLQQLEIKLWVLINKWDKSIPVPTISYNTDFSVKNIAEEVKALMDIASFDLGDIGNKTVLKAIIEKMDEINPMPLDVKENIYKEIDKLQTTLDPIIQRNSGSEDKHDV